MDLKRLAVAHRPKAPMHRGSSRRSVPSNKKISSPPVLKEPEGRARPIIRQALWCSFAVNFKATCIPMTTREILLLQCKVSSIAVQSLKNHLLLQCKVSSTAVQNHTLHTVIPVLSGRDESAPSPDASARTSRYAYPVRKRHRSLSAGSARGDFSDAFTG